MTPLFVLLLSAVFIISTLRSMVVFDEILQEEYMKFRAAWEIDGRPIGFFWVPKEGKVLSGSMARSSLAIRWSFSTPGWAKSQGDLVLLFKKLKRNSILELCVCATLTIVLFTFPK